MRGDEEKKKEEKRRTHFVHLVVVLRVVLVYLDLLIVIKLSEKTIKVAVMVRSATFKIEQHPHHPKQYK